MKNHEILKTLATLNPVSDAEAERWRSAHVDRIRHRAQHTAVTGLIELELPTTEAHIDSGGHPRRVLAGVGLALVAAVAAVVVGLSGTEGDRDVAAVPNTTHVPGPGAPKSEHDAKPDPFAAMSPAEPLPEAEWNDLATDVAAIERANGNQILGIYVRGNRFVVVAAIGKTDVVQEQLSGLATDRVVVTECAVSRQDIDEASAQVEALGPVLATGYTYFFEPSTCSIVVSVSGSVEPAALEEFRTSLGTDERLPVVVSTVDGEYTTFGPRQEG